MILTYTYGGINSLFLGRLRLSMILLSGQRQPVISPDNRGSTVFAGGLFCWTYHRHSLSDEGK
jgi:hypothetical protein